jgi:alpha-mannosidase
VRAVCGVQCACSVRRAVCVQCSYAASHTGRLLLRLAHLYQVGEHPDLAQPATVDLQNVFGQAGLRLTAAVETTLSANRLLEEADKTKHKWQTRATDAAAPPANAKPFEQRVPFVFPKLTVRPMEVRTFLAEFAA